VELKKGKNGADRLKKSGLTITLKDGKAVMDEPQPGTPFFQLSQQFDFYGDAPVTVVKAYEPASRMPKEVFYIPALLLLGVVLLSQLARKRKLDAETAPAAA